MKRFKRSYKPTFAQLVELNKLDNRDCMQVLKDVQHLFPKHSYAIANNKCESVDSKGNYFVYNPLKTGLLQTNIETKARKFYPYA